MLYTLHYLSIFLGTVFDMTKCELQACAKLKRVYNWTSGLGYVLVQVSKVYVFCLIYTAFNAESRD